MQISQDGLDLIKRSEGLRLQVYKDVAGWPTVGYGHKLATGESYPGGITEAAAESFLVSDVEYAEDAVWRVVRVSLSQGQFDALVDFVFNLGGGALAGSTLLQDLNRKQYGIAGLQILIWDHSRVNGQEIELPALKARRQAEFNLWNGRSPAIQPATV